jgi:TonB family protein
LPPGTPVVVRAVAPQYPDAANQARVSGTVRVEVEVGVDGTVASVKPLSTLPILRESALQAARLWRFQPGIAGRTTLTFIYRLESEGACLQKTLAHFSPPTTIEVGARMLPLRCNHCQPRPVIYEVCN